MVLTPSARFAQPHWSLTAVALVLAGCSSATGGSDDVDDIDDQDSSAVEWSAPVSLFETDIRLAAGTALHAVGVSGGTLLHRKSTNEGATWSAATPITGGGTLPIYGPLAADGSNVYLMTRSGGALRVRRSTDGGDTWSAPIALQGYAADNDDRVQMDTEGSSVHVFAGRAGVGGDSSFKIYYWRSVNGGASFSPVVILDDNPVEQPSPGGIAVENGVVHVGYAAITQLGPLGHRARYMRSTDNGATWSDPIDISGPGSNPQIRPRPRVLDGRVIVLWEEPLDYDQQRPLANATRSAIRMNLSLDNGASWLGTRDAAAVPSSYLNHPEVAVGPTGQFHIVYRMSLSQSVLSVADPVGYRRSPDFGSSWGTHEIAVDDPTRETHPLNLVATGSYVHVVTTNGVYARRRVR